MRGRCGSTNQCDYCAKLAAVENAELLALDALAGVAPAVWAVLGTRTVTLDMARFYRSREQVQRAVRRRWPLAEFAWLVEYTTGYGPRAGGRRRPHWNALIKGVPASDVDELRAVMVGVWCRREDAEPRAQWVDLVQETGGLMRYLALHFQKSSQKPPEGFRGHRFTMSRGYLAGSTAEARAAARLSLRHRRELWRAMRRGLHGQAADDAAAAALELAAATSWELVVVDPVTGAGPPAADPVERAGGRAPVPAAIAAVLDQVGDVDVTASQAPDDGPDHPPVGTAPGPSGQAKRSVGPEAPPRPDGPDRRPRSGVGGAPRPSERMGSAPPCASSPEGAASQCLDDVARSRSASPPGVTSDA